MIFAEYELLSRTFTGWSLAEIRAMPVRERQYWRDVVTVRKPKVNHGG